MASNPQRLIRMTLLLAAIASALALGACGGGSGGSSSSSEAASQERVTSTPPGTGPVDSVSWNLPYGEPFTLDYIQALSPSDSTVLANLCPSLIRLGPEMQYEPGLAESWEATDPTTWVFDLRPGLKFSDGKPVTAADVVFSLERNRDPELGSFWEPWFENVKSIAATGKNQVTVKMTKPDALFEQFMATGAGAVAEQAYVEEQGKKYGTSEGGVMCAGPYQLADWTPGTSISIEANPNYWDSQEMPQAKRIEFRFVTNNQTAGDALASGEIDGTFEAPLSAWKSLSSAGSTYLGRSTAYTAINFSEKEGPVQDPSFRRALLYSLDREAIAETIYKGTAEAIRSEFFPTTWGYAKEVYEKGYEAMPDVKPDLDKAKEEFAKVADPKPVKLLANSDDAAAKQLAAYIQSEAAKVGIEIELKELPAAQYVAAAFDREQFNTYDIGLSTSAYLDIAEPVEAGVLSLVSGGVFNSLGYDDPSVDSWVAEARETLDPAKRAELMVKVGRKAFAEDVALIPLVNWSARVYMDPQISGAAASLTPIFYAPWAGKLGAAG